MKHKIIATGIMMVLVTLATGSVYEWKFSGAYDRPSWVVDTLVDTKESTIEPETVRETDTRTQETTGEVQTTEVVTTTGTTLGAETTTPTTEDTETTRVPEFSKGAYGVFLSIGPEEIDRLEGYGIVVIDAAYFSKEEIASLHTDGQKVYTYLNVGSLEDFREYFEVYQKDTLGEYENWPGEYWMDVSSQDWQNLILKKLAPEYVEKGVDGFFIDNCDVYAVYPQKSIYEGLNTILSQLMSYGLKVVVNGGDTYVTAHLEDQGRIGDVMTGVNQESVLTSIDFDKKELIRATSDSKEYFLQYLKTVAANGGDVYVLEYAEDEDIIQDIKTYYQGTDYIYYISDDIELD